jgi:signal peptidase I
MTDVPEFKTEKEAETEIEKEVEEQDPEESPKKPNLFKRIWHFLWEEESVLSYVVFIAVAFILLKFLVFPAVLFMTGYSDIAAVVSESMYHGSSNFNHSYNDWLDFNGYAPEQVSAWPYQNGLNVGDVIFVKKFPAEQIKVGDIILFYAPQGQIIHRVMSIKQVGNDTFFTTKGDANVASMTIEKDIPYSEVKGTLVSKIPFLGYPKVALNLILPKF